MSGLSLCTLGITHDIPSLSRLLLYLSHGVRFFLQKSDPVGQVSISRVKSGLLEISQNELISAGISQTSGYPGISRIFVCLWYPRVGISWDILNFFFIFGISWDYLGYHRNFWDITGFVNFWTCFLGYLRISQKQYFVSGISFFLNGIY